MNEGRKAIKYGYPIILEKYSDVQECESISGRTIFANLVLAMRDTPSDSYIISNSCIRMFDTEKLETICGGKNNKEGGCAYHYRNLVHWADTGKLKPKNLKDLKNYETDIARLPPKIYWRYSAGHAKERKEIFVHRVRDCSFDLENEINKDMTTDKFTVRKKLFKFVRNSVDDWRKIDYGKEAKRYSLINHVGDILQELDLVRKPELSPIQINEHGEVAWYMMAETKWKGDQYLVISLEDDKTTAGLIDSETKYGSALVPIFEEDISTLIDGDSLLSARGMLTRVADTLDDKRWVEMTRTPPVRL